MQVVSFSGPRYRMDELSYWHFSEHSGLLICMQMSLTSNILLEMWKPVSVRKPRSVFFPPLRNVLDCASSLSSYRKRMQISNIKRWENLYITVLNSWLPSMENIFFCITASSYRGGRLKHCHEKEEKFVFTFLNIFRFPSNYSCLSLKV